MNSVSIIGRLTKELELKYTQSGTAVANGSLAVQRQYTNANGECESDFINIVIWRKAAENLANMTAKGSQIGIEGSLQTRNYENRQGQKVYVTEVVVNNFTLIESKEQTEQRKQGGFNQQPQQGAFSPEQMYGTPKNFDSQVPF